MGLRGVGFGNKKMNKRGAEWTVFKLVSIILLVVLLVLVIYGVSTGAFVPLKNKFFAMSDYIGTLLPWGDSSGGASTFTVNADISLPGVDGKIPVEVVIARNYCKLQGMEKEELGALAGYSNDYSVDFENGVWKLKRHMNGEWYNYDTHALTSWRKWERGMYWAMVNKFKRPENYRVVDYSGEDKQSNEGAWMEYDYGTVGDGVTAQIPMWLDAHGLSVLMWGSSDNPQKFSYGDNIDIGRTGLCLFKWYEKGEDVYEDRKLYRCDYIKKMDESVLAYQVYKGLSEALVSNKRNGFTYNGKEYAVGSNVKFVGDWGEAQLPGTGGKPIYIQVKPPGDDFTGNYYSIVYKKQEWGDDSAEYTLYKNAGEKWFPCPMETYWYIYADDSRVEEMEVYGAIKEELLRVCKGNIR